MQDNIERMIIKKKQKNPAILEDKMKKISKETNLRNNNTRLQTSLYGFHS